MKKFVFALAALVLSAPAARSADYVLDDQHTSVVFAVSHFGYSYTYGMFGEYSGDFAVDMDDPSSARFKFTIDVASLDTKSEKRDEHLRGPDFFNVKQFPEITFVSKSVSSDDGETLNVVGDMTMHGETKEITLPLTFVGEGKGPYGKERIGFFGRTELTRSDYGVSAYVPNVGDKVTLIVSFEGLKQ